MGDRLRILAGRAELAAVVARLGQEVADAHPGGVRIVGVLPGSLFLVADLVRAIPAPIEVTVDFLAVSAYGQGEGRVRIVKDLDLSVAGQHVVLVDDIVDTGLTAAYLSDLLARRGAASVELCAILDRPAERFLPVTVRFVGSTVVDEHVLGYGLGHGGRFRNLDSLVVVDRAELSADPESVVTSLYAGVGAETGR